MLEFRLPDELKTCEPAEKSYRLSVTDGHWIISS